MKKFISLIIVIPSILFSNEYRIKLDSALRYESAADKYIIQFEKKLTSETIAYYGVICIMKSNHAGFPFTKLKYFNRGKKALEKAIALFPNNIEYIYFRHEIQRKIPKGLGYNNLVEDAKKLNEYLSNTENKKSDPNLYIQISKLIL